MSYRRSGVLAAVILTYVAAPSSAQMSAVLGIDLGTKFFKVAYVKTGSFDLVLNEASKRKSANAVSFNEGERMVGDTANALVTTTPLLDPSWIIRGAENAFSEACDFSSAAPYRPHGRRSDPATGVKL
jgi:hypothetical protein